MVSLSLFESLLNETHHALYTEKYRVFNTRLHDSGVLRSHNRSRSARFAVAPFARHAMTSSASRATMCSTVKRSPNARRAHMLIMKHIVSSETSCANDDLQRALPNLKKSFSGDWKEAEQSCVIHSITYDSDHLVIKKFINGDSG